MQAIKQDEEFCYNREPGAKKRIQGKDGSSRRVKSKDKEKGRKAGK